MKMMRNKLNVWALAGCMLAAGCGEAKRAGDAERQDATYRAAMAEYSAGRLDQAIDGFEKVLRANPANASARFQLACLLQDRRHDYLGAVCHYREFMLQSPKSDKAQIAGERYAICERMLATELAKKMNLGDNAALAEENAKLRGETEALGRKLAGLEKSLAESERKQVRFERENERLRKLVAAIGEETESEEVPLSAADVERVAAEAGEEEDGDPSADIADARAVEAAETAEGADDAAGSMLLPGHGRDKGGRPKAETEKKKGAGQSDLPARPDFYVVEEGDTLYKIANRFYGRTSAWREIREANKATVTFDGRVNAGQKLRLP